MQRMALKDCFKSSAETKRVMNDPTCVTVSRQTVTRRVGLFTRSPQKRPLLSLKNRKKRLMFAKKHVILPYENWARIVFNDEASLIYLEMMVRTTLRDVKVKD